MGFVLSSINEKNNHTTSHHTWRPAKVDFWHFPLEPAAFRAFLSFLFTAVSSPERSTLQPSMIIKTVFMKSYTEIQK
jgi:hypothetical protein